MKTALAVFSLIAALTLVSASRGSAQLKSQSAEDRSAAASLVQQRGPGGGFAGGLSSFFGLLDPNRFLMRHTLSYNYLTAGGQGMSIASYTNSMFYSIADPLDVRFDVTLQGSPFGPTAGAERSELNRIYLSRAEMNYRPWENVSFHLQYREMPWSLYRNQFNPWYDMHPWYESDPWRDR